MRISWLLYICCSKVLSKWLVLLWPESHETSRLQRCQNKKPLQSAIWRIGKRSLANIKRMESRPQVWITCTPSVLRHCSISSDLSPFPAQKKKKCWISRVQSAFSVYFISMFPEDTHNIWWMGWSEFNEKNGWDKLGNILWDLFKVRRFLTCWRSECKRIASDLLLSSGFRANWRQSSLGACWKWWKAKVPPVREAENLELDLGKSSSASRTEAFSDSLLQHRQIQVQGSDSVYIQVTPCKAVASSHLLTLVLPKRN